MKNTTTNNNTKRDIRSLNMLDAMILSVDIAHIQAEYSQQCVDIAVKHGIDPMDVINLWM